MDPDAVLRTIRDRLIDYRDADTTGDTDAADAALHDLANVTEAMDEWLSRGGFPPQQWQRLHTLNSPQANRVAKATYLASRGAAVLPWEELYPSAQEHWHGIASVAISEYLHVLGYELVPFSDTQGRDAPPS